MSSQKPRTHSIVAESSEGSDQIPSMLSMQGIERSQNGVVSGMTWAMAPPNFHVEAYVISEGRFARCAVISLMTSSSRRVRHVDFQ
jgi:hypothetical protein